MGHYGKFIGKVFRVACSQAVSRASLAVVKMLMSVTLAGQAYRFDVETTLWSIRLQRASISSNEPFYWWRTKHNKV